MPIERVLLGATSPNGVKLTKKQKAFAEQVVATGNKTEAYKRAYDTKGSSKTASRDAQKVASKPAVSTYIEALEAAKEAREYLLPTRLREMAIQKLASLALSNEIAPAQQLKALELVGKMTEVALFSERREIVHSLNSADLKAKLMDAVQLALVNSKGLRTQTKRSAAELLAEITQEHGSIDVESRPVETNNQDNDPDQTNSKTNQSSSDLEGDGSSIPVLPTPTEGQPPFLSEPTAGHLHSISHNQSPLLTREGVSNSIEVLVGTDIEMTPLPNSEQK